MRRKKFAMQKEGKISKFKRWVKEEGFWRVFWRIILIFTSGLLVHVGYCFIRIKRKQSRTYINNPEEVIYIPTEMIKQSVLCSYQREAEIGEKRLQAREELVSICREGKFFNGYKKGEIRGGDWDLKCKDVKDHLVFNAFRQRFVENKSWKKTLYYKMFVHLRSEGELWHSSTTWEDMKNTKLQEWDSLYEELKKNGYKTQEGLGKKYGKEIQVGIARNGEVLFLDGRHRLALAKICGIKNIPVVVSVWHKRYIDWVKKEYDLKNPTPKDAIKPILNTLKPGDIGLDKGSISE